MFAGKTALSAKARYLETELEAALAVATQQEIPLGTLWALRLR
jgi:hypothetical protein